MLFGYILGATHSLHVGVADPIDALVVPPVLPPARVRDVVDLDRQGRCVRDREPRIGGGVPDTPSFIQSLLYVTKK